MKIRRILLFALYFVHNICSFKNYQGGNLKRTNRFHPSILSSSLIQEVEHYVQIEDDIIERLTKGIEDNLNKRSLLSRDLFETSNTKWQNPFFSSLSEAVEVTAMIFIFT